MATTQQIPFVGDMDFSTVHFGPFENKDNKTKVEVFRDASSTANKNKFNRLNLCRDACEPIETKYALDSVPPEGNPNRRGLSLKIQDVKVIEAFHALDEAIVRKAVECSKEWFKKTLNEDQVRARYKPILEKKKEEETFETMKIKVKCGDYATNLHIVEDGGRVRKHAGKPEDLSYGSKVAPIVSASYGLWFMGGGSSFGLSFQAEEMIVTPGKEADDSLAYFASSKPIELVSKAEASSGETEETEDNAKRPRVELVEKDEDEEGESAM